MALCVAQVMCAGASQLCELLMQGLLPLGLLRAVEYSAVMTRCMQLLHECQERAMSYTCPQVFHG